MQYFQFHAITQVLIFFASLPALESAREVTFFPTILQDEIKKTWITLWLDHDIYSSANGIINFILFNDNNKNDRIFIKFINFDAEIELLVLTWRNDG